MHTLLSILPLLAAPAAALSFASNASQYNSPAQACSLFDRNWPNLTYFANSTLYTEANTEYFDAQAWLGPACVFAPTNSNLMSQAVKILKELRTPFAIRGAGHMPIDDAANINSTGVLLSAVGLSQLKISDDRTSVTVGPGNRWSNVYEYLEPYGLTVVGGRMGVVGVPGFLLGGGISFFGNQYGWASANVVKTTCILANGDIVEATATNDYADLFWALRGGGNSFAIITSFELKTFKAPVVTVGQTSYGTGKRDQWLDSVLSFTHNGSDDSKSAVTPIARWGAGMESPAYYAMLFYDGNDTSPVSLTNFTTSANDMAPINNTMSTRSMYQWTEESDEGFDEIHGLRTKFHVISIRADADALAIVHDTFMEAVQAQLADVEDIYISLTPNIVSKNYIVTSYTNGGDPQGVDPTNAPYLWVELSYIWGDAEDDSKIEAFSNGIDANITAQLEALDKEVLSPYLYLNDADKGQPVFEGYPAQNLMFLKTIREKYDPERVFTDLMPGGWKVADV